MRIAGLDPELVLDLDEPPIARLPAGMDHDAVGRGVDRACPWDAAKSVPSCIRVRPVFGSRRLPKPLVKRKDDFTGTAKGVFSTAIR